MTGGATARNSLQLMVQGQEKVTFEKEVSKSQHKIDNLKICC